MANNDHPIMPDTANW